MDMMSQPLEQLMESLTGLVDFAGYFSLSLLLLLAFKFLYTLLTPHDEWRLVKEEQNKAAALGLGGAILGFAIALSGAATNSVSIVDFAVWAVVALFAQLLAYALVRLTFMPKIAQRIAADEFPAGIILAATSVAVGVLNAACMSY